MRPRNFVGAACSALAFASGAMAQETVTLEHKLKPNTELTYPSSETFEGNARLGVHWPGFLCEGSMRVFVRMPL
jgi:hypothetical protein